MCRLRGTQLSASSVTGNASTPYDQPQREGGWARQLRRSNLGKPKVASRNPTAFFRNPPERNQGWRRLRSLSETGPFPAPSTYRATEPPQVLQVPRRTMPPGFSSPPKSTISTAPRQWLHQTLVVMASRAAGPTSRQNLAAVGVNSGMGVRPLRPAVPASTVRGGRQLRRYPARYL